MKRHFAGHVARIGTPWGNERIARLLVNGARIGSARDAVA